MQLNYNNSTCIVFSARIVVVFFSLMIICISDAVYVVLVTSKVPVQVCVTCVCGRVFYTFIERWFGVILLGGNSTVIPYAQQQ